MLACAPAFFILSRYALDYTLPVPFILGWLLCLLIALDSPRSRGWFAASGLCLGFGWYCVHLFDCDDAGLRRDDARRDCRPPARLA